MQTALTPGVARQLGRTLRFLRTGRGLRMLDVHQKTGLSVPYIANLERGDRRNADDEQFQRLARGLSISDEAMRHLVLRARVMSAFELAQIPPDAAEFGWAGLERRLAEKGVPLQLDLPKLIADMIEGRRDS